MGISFDEILSQTRKYQMGIVGWHQDSQWLWQTVYFISYDRKNDTKGGFNDTFINLNPQMSDAYQETQGVNDQTRRFA